MQSASIETNSPRYSRTLRRYVRRQSPSARIVAFPWCGGGASVYRKLASQLPPHIELLAVQLPGREDRFGEPLLRRMTDVVDHVIEDMAGLDDVPLVLFGHSMGAVVAYEVAVAMQERMQRSPDMLIVSGRGAPMSYRLGRGNWHAATDSDFLGHIGRLGGTPADVLNDPDMMRFFVPILRADYEALETCECRPPRTLSCPLYACAGTEDKQVTNDSVDAWRMYTNDAFLLHWFEGGHFYLVDKLQALSRCLEDWIGHGDVCAGSEAGSPGAIDKSE